MPKLRFPEFRDTGEWKVVGFYDLLESVLDFRGRTPVKLGMSWGNGDIISLSANNVKNGYIDFAAECNLGSIDLYEKWMGKVNLEINDIVFTMEAPLGNALLIPDSRKYILSQRVVAFKTKDNVENSFLIQLIWSESFQRSINKLATGSTAQGINQKALKSVYVNTPTLKEQQKIADCLSSLDDLITAHTKKLDHLKTHKKGLMQQLFPAEGETVPKLRFPEIREAGEWESTTLGKIASLHKGKGISKAEIDDTGKSFCIRYGELYTKYKEAIFTVYSKTTTPTNELVLSKKNDVLIPSSGETKIDIATASCVMQDGIAIGGDINVIRSNQNGVFLSYYLNSAKKLDIAKLAQGDAVVHLYISQLELLNVVIPTLIEQQKIADCLLSLDNLITVQIQKIEALKLHKKGLMQQLFPTADEVDSE